VSVAASPLFPFSDRRNRYRTDARMTPDHGKLHVFDTPESLAEQAAAWLCESAMQQDGNFVVSLSGGSTPKRLYECLAADPIKSRMPWDRIIWTFGDERFVPPDDKDSNYRMVREALFDHVPVPRENIHPFQTVGVSPEQSAQASGFSVGFHPARAR
jgi:6-phosphogluconolactonase